MPKMLRYTPEFKEQRVRLVFSEIGPDESRKAACERLGARVNVKAVTLYNWVKDAAPTVSPPRLPARRKTCLPSWLRCARRTVSSPGRTRFRARPRLSSGRSSTANRRSSGVRHRQPAPVHERCTVGTRADLQGAAGLPSLGAMRVAAPAGATADR